MYVLPARRIYLLCLGMCVLAVFLCGCAPRIPHELPAGGGHLPHDASAAARPITDWLALVAGIAGIGCAIWFGAVLKDGRGAAIGVGGCIGACLLFLVLPSVVTVVTWALVVGVVLAFLAVGFLGYRAWKNAVDRDRATVAVAVVAKHADRMEAAETSADVAAAKLVSIAEQDATGVRSLIQTVRA
jgi:hypothetical protein